jgi:Kef-type K+ transport system membrane component KefB
MSATLTLVLVVAVAYLAAHLAFDWIARRFLIVSGVEYLILGILLGPQVSGVLSADVMASFAPLTLIALGWVGAIVGTQFYLPELIRLQSVHFKVAFTQSLVTLAVVSAVLTPALAWVLDVSWAVAAGPAIALGAIATASAPAGIEVVVRTLARRGPVVRQLEVATAIDSLVAVVAFGVLIAIIHPGHAGDYRQLTATEWIAVTLALGAIGGVLFHLFVGSERDTDRLVISLGGAVILVSGAAAYLGLSPLLPAMIVGATLVNTSRNRDEIARTLASAERPFYFVLLILAGASWQPVGRAWIIPVALFLLLRAAGKLGGARLGARANGVLPILGPHWGRALLGHGGIALALALDYSGHASAPARGIVFSAAIVSVLLTDLSSARLVRSVVAPLLERAAVRVRGAVNHATRGAR